MQKQRRGSRDKGIEFQSKWDSRITEAFGDENGHREMKYAKHNKNFSFCYGRQWRFSESRCREVGKTEAGVK